MKRNLITLVFMLLLVPLLGFRVSAETDSQYIGYPSDYEGSIVYSDPLSTTTNYSEEMTIGPENTTTFTSSSSSTRYYLKWNEITLTYNGTAQTYALEQGESIYLSIQVPIKYDANYITYQVQFENSLSPVTFSNASSSFHGYTGNVYINERGYWYYHNEDALYTIINFYVKITAEIDTNFTIEEGTYLTLTNMSFYSQVALYDTGGSSLSIMPTYAGYPVSFLIGSSIPFTEEGGTSGTTPTPTPTETPTEEVTSGSVDLSTIESNQDEQTGLLQSIYSGVTGLLQSIYDELSELSEAVQYGWSQLGQMLATTAATITSSISNIQGWISSAASSIVSGITSAINQIEDWISSAASSITSGISSAISGLADSIIGSPSEMWETVTESDLYESLSGFESFSDDFYQDVIDIYNVDPSFIITIPAFSISLSSGTHQIWSERTYDCGAYIESVPGLLNVIRTVVDIVIILAAIKYVLVCVERIRIVISGGALGREVDALRYLKD